MVSFYCPVCFYKAHGRVVSTACHCGAQMRSAKNVRQRAAMVTRLKNKAGNKTNKRSQYQLYLESDVWLAIRDRVLERDGNTCQCCGRPAKVVHHRDYSNSTMTGESIDRLISLCKKCHKFIHRDDKGSRTGIRATEAKLVSVLDRRRTDGF